MLSPLFYFPEAERPEQGIYSDYFTTAVRTAGKAGETSGVSFLLIPKGRALLSLSNFIIFCAQLSLFCVAGVTCKRMLMSGQWCAVRRCALSSPSVLE